MSVKITTAVWLLDLPQPLKLLALCLGDWADDWGENVRPSIAYTAWKLGASERTVQRQMRQLEALGIVEVVKKRGYQLHSGQWVPLLRIHPGKGNPLPEWGDRLSPLGGRGDTAGGKGVTNQGESGDTAMAPNTLGNTLDIPPGDSSFEPEPDLPSRLPGESRGDYARRVMQGS